jgi:DNA transposition AAA+ family ATPase
MDGLETIKKYLAQGGTSAALARGANLSSATVSLFLSGKYTGDNQSVESALLSFIEAQEEKVKTAPVVEIDAFTRIIKTAAASRANGKLSVVCGRAGTGKTTACKTYAENNRGTIYICADMSCSAQDLFIEIVETLGLKASYSLRTNFLTAREKLAGTRRLIIIDEAEHLSYKALDLLRSLFDATGCGLMLVGTETLIHNLRGKRGEYEQLHSRVAIFQKTAALELSDVEAFLEKAAPSAKSLSPVFLKHCGGNMRVLANLVWDCVRVAEKSKCEINKNVIKTVIENSFAA